MHHDDYAAAGLGLVAGMRMAPAAEVHDGSEGTMSDTTPAMSHYDLVTRMATRAFAPRRCTVSTATQRALQRPVR